MKSPNNSECKLTRRNLLKYTPVAMATLTASVKNSEAGENWLDPRKVLETAGVSTDKNVRVVNTACLGCNARCGLLMAVRDEKIQTVTGNPYHPYNTKFQPVAYDSPLAEGLQYPASVCGKAHDVSNYVTNPYRIVGPMKRSGPRGSGKFEPIEWATMIREISEGGRLFSHLGEDRHVPGIKQLNSDDPIDRDAPELGPVRNGFVFMAGRDQSGRKEFTDRFVKEALGSVNRVSHTDICGLGFRMGNFAMSEKKQAEFKADPVNAEYILVFGANIYEALQPGINTYGALVANRYSAGKTRFTIIDPRATHASTHAEEWIAVTPGQDGAFAMGLIRWIIDNNRFNAEYLTASNVKSAEKIGHGSYSNATHLVIVDASHINYRRFLRMSDLDPALSGDPGQAFVVLDQDSSPQPFDTLDHAELDRDTTVSDMTGKTIRVKTAFRLLKEECWKHSLYDYARLAGVERMAIERVAREFTSHGTRAAVCQYHGAGNYAGGVPAAYAIALLNVLIGSIDRKGGYLKGGGGAAPWNVGDFDLKTFAGQRKAQGVMLSREKASYETSSEFKKKKSEGGSGYPAKRPWFPFTLGGLCVETLSGIDQMYPYSCKILFSYFFNPIYSIPGGRRFVSTLQDEEKVPLHVSIDIGVNESNLYADYIVPDITYPEGHYAFLTPHAPALKFTAVRTPAIRPLTGSTNDNRPYCLETLLIDLAVASGLPGFGPDVIPGKDGRTHALLQGEDYYLRGIVNLAEGAKIAEASTQEIAFVEKNYPVAEFKKLLDGPQWRKACRVLARGGVFSHRYEDGFDEEKHRNGIKKVALYNEDLAASRHFMTGEHFPGTATYYPPVDGTGNNLAYVDREFPYILVTHKMNLHAQSRTTSHRWSMEVFPENYVVIHESDAMREGIKNSDLVRLISHSHPQGVVGRAKVSTLVKAGCVAVSFHYGHTQMGASSLPISSADLLFLGGKRVADHNGLRGDSSLGAGIQPNDLSRLDETLGNLPLIDVMAGIPDFSSTRVRIVKS